jgi:FkbH-like protein
MNDIENKIYSSEHGVQLTTVIDFLNKIEKENTQFSHLVKISILRNYTIEGIEPFLKYHLYNSRINVLIHFGGYDTFIQEILDSSSCAHQFHPDIIILSLMLDNFTSRLDSLDWKSDEAIEKIEECFSLLSSKTNSLIIVNTFIPPFYSPLGITNSTAIPDKYYEVSKLNQYIRDYIKQHNAQFFLVDFERILRMIGEERSMDYRFWYSSKAPFKKDFLNTYALEITKIVNALKGKAKKCLILDCDNTLWGGIIGEDGINGIKLDKNMYPHNIYYKFQQSVINLYERGVTIILCSKNNEEDVWDVMDNHPHCLLKREHIASWRIDWDDKHNNIKSIADELNLGLDSFVFIDDNPIECELVKTMLPDVTVIQVPQKLYTYPQILLKNGLFDTLFISDEDKKRTQMYRAEKQRKINENNYSNVDEYLCSLNIVAKMHEAVESEIARVAQLTQKTNQFNLTTRRYSEPQIQEYIKNQSSSVLSLTVSDKFGDMGLTGVLIAHNQNERIIIDSLLISCRILGRKTEIAFVDHCIRYLAKKWRSDIFEAEYIPTQKNKQTEDFWIKVGFKEVDNTEQHKKYVLNYQEYQTQKSEYIKIE